MLIEMRVIALLMPGQCARIEGHHDVRMMPLWADVGLRIRLADVQFAQHFCFCVPAPCGVSPSLPAAPQLLGWIEKNTHTVGVPHLLPVHAKQPLDGPESPQRYVPWRPTVAP